MYMFRSGCKFPYRKQNTISECLFPLQMLQPSNGTKDPTVIDCATNHVNKPATGKCQLVVVTYVH